MKRRIIQCHVFQRFPTLSSASGDVWNVELTIVGEDIKKSCQPRKHYNTNISESIKLEFRNFTKVHETKTSLDKFQKNYPRHTFVQTSINNWKRRITSGGKLQKKKGIANILLDFGLFVLYENKFTIIFVTQKEPYNIQM